MTSTPSAVLSLELQAQNDNAGAWWTNANQIFQSIEDAIAKEVALATTGGDTALSVASYSVDQSRCAIIRIGAGQTLLSLVRVTTARARLYFVTNETAAGSFDVKFGGDTSNLVTIPRNTGAWVRVRSTAATTFASPLVNLTTGAIDGASLASGAFLLGASNLSDLASAATARTNLGLAIGTNVQAYAANLTSWAATTPTAERQIPLETGTVMPFFQAAAPTGWTKQTTHNDKSIRIVSGTGGGNGGSVAFSTLFARTATDAHTLTTAEMPAHTHAASSGNFYGTVNTGLGTAAVGSGTGTEYQLAATGSTGGGGSHTHDIDLRLQYVDMILCQRN